MRRKSVKQLDDERPLTPGLTEHTVQEADLISPVLVRARLSLWEEERLPRVETPPDVGEAAVLPGNLDYAVQTEQVERRSARFEDDAVRCDE